MDLGIWVIVSALVGAKLLLILVDLPRFLASPAEIFSLVRSGGVFYGGLALAVGVGFWYMRRHRLPLWTTADLFAPGIALGHVIGRLGCFFGGLLLRPADRSARGRSPSPRRWRRRSWARPWVSRCTPRSSTSREPNW